MLVGASADPRLLTLEVIESAFVRDGDRALSVLNDLRDLGTEDSPRHRARLRVRPRDAR